MDRRQFLGSLLVAPAVVKAVVLAPAVVPGVALPLSEISPAILQDAYLDMEAWLRADFARAMAEHMEKYFVHGTGT